MLTALGCTCDKIEPMNKINLTEYARKTWYIQKQHISIKP